MLHESRRCSKLCCTPVMTLTQYLLYPAAKFADLSKCFYEGGFCLPWFNVSFDTVLSSQLISIKTAEGINGQVSRRMYTRLHG
jgi:hypothetical protein